MPLSRLDCYLPLSLCALTCSDDSEGASVLFPTVQSEEPYSEGSVDNCEIIGPIGMIQGHPVQITVTKKKQPEK